MPAIRIVLAREYNEQGTDLGAASVGRLNAALTKVDKKNDWFVFGASAPPDAEEGSPTLALLQAQHVRKQGAKVYTPLTPHLGWGTYDELRAALLTALELSVQFGRSVDEIVIHTSSDHLSRTKTYARFLLKKVQELAPLAEHDVVRFSSSTHDLSLWGRCREAAAIFALLFGVTTTPRWARQCKKIFLSVLQAVGEYEIERLQHGEVSNMARE